MRSFLVEIEETPRQGIQLFLEAHEAVCLIQEVVGAPELRLGLVDAVLEPEHVHRELVEPCADLAARGELLPLHGPERLEDGPDLHPGIIPTRMGSIPLAET